MKNTISMLGAWTIVWFMFLGVIVFDVNSIQVVHAEDFIVSETDTDEDSNIITSLPAVEADTDEETSAPQLPGTETDTDEEMVDNENNNGSGNHTTVGGRSSGSRRSSGGEVLGSSTLPDPSCGLYLNDYMRIGVVNNSFEVTKLQIFLNEFIDAKIAVNGVFGVETDLAVKKLQAKYADEILKPWVDAGFGPTPPTGYVYITTRYFINVEKCKELDLIRPTLRLDTSNQMNLSIPATNGAVLGTSTGVTGNACGIYLHDYLKQGIDNNPEEVKKLQLFLNEFIKTDLAITGVFGEETDSAVRRLQAEYMESILKPWTDAGVTVDASPTGYVYKTTQHFINTKKCPDLNLALPELN